MNLVRLITRIASFCILITVAACSDSQDADFLEISISPESEDFESILAEVCNAYGIPLVVAQEIHQIENSGRKNGDAKRFEPGQMARASRIAPTNKKLAQEYATSWGPMQIMGWWSAAYGVPLSQLRSSTRENLEFFGVVYGNCQEKKAKELARKGKVSKLDLVAAAGACYNGSTEYGQELAARVRERVLDTVL